MTEKLTRRAMLVGTAASAAALAGCSTTGHHDHGGHHVPAPAAPAITLKQGATVLIQGDSITDAGRDKSRQDEVNDFAQMGNGYARMIGWHLLTKHADKELKVYNRGISGHKVPDLVARWDRDCIDLQPDVLSILIGVNDIWHKLAGRYDGTVQDYGAGFAALLARTKAALPQTQIIVCEPFALRCGAVNENWFPEFDERRAAAKVVADEAGALFIPFQAMFDAAVEAGAPPEHFGRDGVHPSPQGQALMATRWLGDTGLA